MLLVPLTEWGGIDLNDAALHEGVGTQQLVIGGVIHNIKHTSALGDGCKKQSVSESVHTLAQGCADNRLIRCCSKYCTDIVRFDAAQSSAQTSFDSMLLKVCTDIV